MNKRRLKQGSYGIAVTALAIAGIILLNAAVGLLTERFSLKIDLTDNELYTLAEETRAALSGMTEDVTFTVLSNEARWESLYSRTVTEAVRNYVPVSNGKLTLRFMDPDTNPQLAEQYPAFSSFNQNNSIDIIVESARRVTKLSSEELLVKEPNYTTYSMEVTGLRIDQALTTAIVYVLNETLPKAVFVENHGEMAGSVLKKYFESLSYVTQTLNLATEDIPQDTSFLIFNSPAYDIDENEKDKLDAFRASGGDIIILYGADTPKLATMDMFLGEWGIEVGPEIVVHDTYADPTDKLFLYAFASAGGAESLAELAGISNTPNIRAYAARPIVSHWNNDRKSENNLLYRLITMEKGAYLYNEKGKVEGSEGPHALAMLNHRYDYVDNELVDSYLLVANASMFIDEFLQNVRMNAEFLSRLVLDMNPGTVSVSIPAKSLQIEPLDIMGWQTQAVFVLLCVLLPLLIVALGLLTWRRRKRL